MFTRLLATWLTVAEVIAPAAAASEPASEAAAPSHWDLADEHAAQGRHDRAVEEYALAFDERGAPAILYSWAQSERLRGRCDEALPLYERFLVAAEVTPPEYDAEGLREQWANMRVNAERQRGVCREAVAAQQAASVPPPEVTRAPDRTTAVPARVDPAPPRPASWRRDAAGWSLVAIGLAASAAGAALLGVAAATDADAPDRPSHQGFRDAIARAQLEQRAGIGVLAAGGALLLGGVIRLAVVAARSRRARPIAHRR